MTPGPRSFLATLGLLAILLLVACGGGASDVFDEPAEASKLLVRLDEYKIATKPTDVTDAVTKIKAQDTGTIAHELKIIRSDLAADALPQKSGLVDEDKLQVVAKTKELKRRDKATLDVKLTPGNYVLICNISGHYALGMRASMKVVASTTASAP